jgi:hypothetical protein
MRWQACIEPAQERLQKSGGGRAYKRFTRQKGLGGAKANEGREALGSSRRRAKDTTISSEPATAQTGHTADPEQSTLSPGAECCAYGHT